MKARKLLLATALVAAARCAPSKQAVAGEKKRDVTESGALGSVAIASPILGQQTIAPPTCRAGDRQFFLGADFEDARAGLVLRFLLDPLEGPAFRLYSQAAPFEKSVIFRRGDCRTLKFSFNPTTMRIDRVQDYKMSLEFECATSGGDSISGKLSADHCH